MLENCRFWFSYFVFGNGSTAKILTVVVYVIFRRKLFDVFVVISRRFYYSKYFRFWNETTVNCNFGTLAKFSKYFYESYLLFTVGKRLTGTRRVLKTITSRLIMLFLFFENEIFSLFVDK